MADAAEALVGPHPAYISVPRELILSGAVNALPAGRTVLQLGPEVGSDAEVVSAVRRLSVRGFPIALDGRRDWSDPGPLLGIANIVRLDAASGPNSLMREVDQVRAASACALVARNVDSHESLDLCKTLEFDLFQGLFWAQPDLSEQRAIQASRLSRIQLLSELRRTDADFDVLHEVIARDIGLSYGILRFVNSAFFALPRTIESVKDACVLLGLAPMRRWATTMTLVGAEGDKPPELIVAGLTRARMCELFAVETGQSDKDGFFTAGLFSVLDALMDASMVEVLASLPLADDINDAILNFGGDKGAALRCAIAWERGRFSDIDESSGVSLPRLGELYLDAVSWAEHAATSMR